METAVRSALLLPRLPAAVSVRLLLPPTKLLRRLLWLLWLRRLLGVGVTRHDFLLAVCGFLGGARPGDRSPVKKYPRCRHNDPHCGEGKSPNRWGGGSAISAHAAANREAPQLRHDEEGREAPPKPPSTGSASSSGSGSGRPTTRGLATRSALGHFRSPVVLLRLRRQAARESPTPADRRRSHSLPRGLRRPFGTFAVSPSQR